MAEIQERSNITYRLYDYDRVDKYTGYKTRKCLALEVDTSIGDEQVTRFLDKVILLYRMPALNIAMIFSRSRELQPFLLTEKWR